jgi:hypothetical protein
MAVQSTDITANANGQNSHSQSAMSNKSSPHIFALRFQCTCTNHDEISSKSNPGVNEKAVLIICPSGIHPIATLELQ